jgi:uncharacterized protein YllA (UPF0747 family)
MVEESPHRSRIVCEKNNLLRSISDYTPQTVAAEKANRIAKITEDLFLFHRNPQYTRTLLQTIKCAKKPRNPAIKTWCDMHYAIVKANFTHTFVKIL